MGRIGPFERQPGGGILAGPEELQTVNECAFIDPVCADGRGERPRHFRHRLGLSNVERHDEHRVRDGQCQSEQPGGGLAHRRNSSV